MGHENILEKYRETCAKLDLDYHAILMHQKRLLQAHTKNIQPDVIEKQTFDVIDTCRVDNGGILPERWPFSMPQGVKRKEFEGRVSGMAAFVLAAGAGSRYFQPLTELNESLIKNDLSAVTKAANTLKEKGALSWPLPERLRTFIRNVDEKDFEAMKSLMTLPKALLPCVMEGTTFLEMKCRENIELKSLAAQIFIAPYRMKAVFQKAINQNKCKAVQGGNNLKTLLLEQGPKLSTLRFYEDGSPVLEDDQSLSMVPAGHGSLIKLFHDAADIYPEIDSLFIRNIDNVTGAGKDAVNATNDFLIAYYFIKKSLDMIRKSMQVRDYTAAREAAFQILNVLPHETITHEGRSFLKAISDKNVETLWRLQMAFFHTYPKTSDAKDMKTLSSLFARPLNVLAEVPNTGKDMGGGPVFVKTANGTQKVCLEIPHASEEDKRKYFADPKKATHFNPVFIASEIRNQEGAFVGITDLENSPFWLMASKNYRGRKVMYHETLLSEVLGNSMNSNAVFIATPRILFNPHKSLEDAKDVKLKKWCQTSNI